MVVEQPVVAVTQSLRWLPPAESAKSAAAGDTKSSTCGVTRGGGGAEIDRSLLDHGVFRNAEGLNLVRYSDGATPVCRRNGFRK